MNRKITKTVLLCLILYLAAGIAFKTVIGFDPDEQYAYSMMHRFSEGDHYLIDLFDAYQFSALLFTPVYQFSVFLSKAGILNPVLLTRIFSAVILGLLNLRTAFFVYRKTGDRVLALLGWIVMISALPKSILTVEHSNLALIGISWIAIDVMDCRNDRNAGWKIGFDASFLSLVYPPLLLIYIPIGIFLLVHRDYKKLLQMISVSAVILAAVLIPLLLKGGIHQVVSAVQMVLMDGSHDQTISGRISAFGTDLLYLGKYIVVYLVLFVILWSMNHFLLHKKLTAEQLLIMVPFLTAVIQFTLRKTSPMAGNGRYLLLVLFCLVLSLHKSGTNEYTKEGTAAALLYCWAFIVIYLSSNTNLLSASGFMMASPILYVILQYRKENARAMKGLMALIAVSQITTMIFTYRTWGTTEHSIFHLDLVNDTNVLNGLYYEPKSFALFSELTEHKGDLKGQGVVAATIYPYAYSILDKEVLAPVTAATLVFNEQWSRYYACGVPETLDLIHGTADTEIIDIEPLLGMLTEYYRNVETQVYDTFTVYHFCERISSGNEWHAE